MERFSQRESLLLGYSPQRSLMNSGSSPSSSNKTSDVDFHDVFGGPPRRSSTHETRYSFNGVTDTNVFKEDDDEAWSGLGEKPVFGEESMNRRRTQSDDFFDDIFKSNNSVSSSSRRLQRDPFSSAPGSRVLSPVRSLPLKAEISEGSSLPTQFSLPARLTKAVDVPTIGSTGRTTSLSRFSNQAIQSPEDSRNDIHSYLRQSSLSREFSLGGEGSSTLGTPDRADTGSNFGKDAKSSENPTSSRPFQFHFSIYKWASKGVPMVIPHRGRLGSRVQESTKNEESQPSTNESPANESTGRQSPKSTLPTIDSPSNDHWLGDATLERNKQENDLLLDESTPDKVESEALSSLHDTVEDVSGSDERIKAGGRKENMVTGTKKSSADVGSNKLARTRSGKRSSSTNSNEVDRAIVPGSPRNSRDNPRRSNVKGKVKDFVSSSTNSNEVDRAIFPGSPRHSRDNPGRSNVKGKVKDFVKMFSQEVVCKSTYVGDLGSQSSKMKDKGIFKAEKEVIISATRMDEDLQQSTVRNPFPDASKMINEDLKQLKKEHREVKTVDDILSNASLKDVLASRTGSVPNGPKAIIGDADDCFQIKELPEEEKKQPQAGNCHEEIRAIDAKIRRWSRGKEGNIRSLLTTMQDVLWPESGWKTVPLVDIIEGNSVKRTYQRALLCLHPDKLQQKGAPSDHKYLAAKVFDILQEAWNHFNSLGPL